MWDNTTLEYYDFDESESIQSEVAFTYTTDFSRQLVSIKIVWKYFVNLFNLLGKHEDHFENFFFLAKWLLGGIFSLSLYFTVNNLFPVRPILPLGIMIHVWKNFILPYMRMLPDKLHFIWPTVFLRGIFGL